jgi:glycosyltransferase involved in cell wall biosynthesis
MNLSSNVTVIIPCYNDGAYIEQAINSIVNQTVKPDKIIVIDDGSDEATKTVLRKIVVENLELIFQKNQGVCKTRNNAIRLTTTDYILNLDADDYFEPSFIEKAVNILKRNPDVGIVGCWYKIFGNKERNNEIIKPLGGNIDNFLFKNNGLGTSMYRKKCWEEVLGYDEKMTKGYEDWDFWIGILSNKWEMQIIKEVLFNYRVKTISRDIIALNNFDFELREYIFLKHKEVFYNNYELFALQLIEENCKLRNKNRIIKNSSNYRIGTVLMNPLRVFNVIKNKLTK